MTWTTRPRSDFGTLRALRAGSGPALLLLHGVGLRAEAWGAQIDALSDRFDIIAPDMPGHGESRPFAHRPALADYTDRIADALTGPVLVAGHSMGALIALDLALRHPGLVRGAAVLNAIFRRSPEARAAVRARAGALPADRAADPGPALARWFGERATPEADACRRWLASVDPAAYKAAYTVFADEDGPADAALERMKAPLLAMTGAEEPNSTPAMSRALAALAPSGRAVIVEGAAHMMPMTHPARVNAELAAHFAGCPA